MDTRPQKSSGLLASLNKSLRGLAGKSSQPARGAEPVRQRSSSPPLASLPEEDEHDEQPSSSPCQPPSTTTTPTAHSATHANATQQPMSTRPASAPPTAGMQTSRLSADGQRTMPPSASSMMRGDSASSTTISQATCPVALANLRVRQDLYTLGKALERMMSQVRASSPLAYWQVEALHKRFQVMHKLARDLHRHEEESLYPMVRKHARLCETLQCQNTSLSVLWNSLRNTVYSLRHTQDAATDGEVLREIMLAHAQLFAAVKAHWAELDAKLLPIIHKECSPEELAASDCRLLREPSHLDWAHFLSMQKDEASKRALMKHMGVSRITAALVLLRACKQYNSEVGPLFQDLQAGCPGEGRGKNSGGSGGSFLSGVGFGI